MKKQRNQRIKKFWIFFGLSIAVSFLVTAAYIRNRMALEQSQMEQVAMERANKVNIVLTKLLYKTQVLSTTVVHADGEVENFEQMAATILDDPSIKNLILAPDGVVSYVYPLEGNEKVLGLDYFSQGAGNKEAILAKDTKSLVLGGPFELVQGGHALVGRLPVYLSDGIFWGIVSVTLNYPDALSAAELEQLKTSGFAYEIWRVNPDTQERQIIASSPYQYSKTPRYVEYPMKLLNAEWYFRLSPIHSWYEFPETWIFIFISSLISLLIGLLMMHNYDLNCVRINLEEISFRDPLTGLLNRRGSFLQLQNVEDTAPYVLCYLDMDNFKGINDNFGHNAGDFFLCRFAELVEANLKGRRYIFARVGGDEFILVCPGTDDEEHMQTLLKHLRETVFSSPLYWEETPIWITFSAGLSVRPTDGTTLDELLSVADKRMYEYKNKIQDGKTN